MSLLRFAAIGSIWFLLGSAAYAQIAPDASQPGPLATTTWEYKLPAAVDPDVSQLPTELWARVYMPAEYPPNPMPVLVFLHGNHATCGAGANPRVDTSTEYTFYGTCPPTAPIVVPNHEGYGYLADRLASWGYFVVSINANRGINGAPGPSDDLGLNLARGRLILKHLQRLSEANHGSDLLGGGMTGTLDFSQVGLFGHSRGGEGVRAAYNFYNFGDVVPWNTQIPDTVTFRGIFEIGPVDGQTSLVLDPIGTKWNVLLPMCDGDVSNLQGVRPFDRLMMAMNDRTQKSTFQVWGANHNYFNTEWQTSDSPGCAGPGNMPLFTMPVGSPQQRQTALSSVLAFFRGNVGPNADPSFNQNFDPEFGLPAILTAVTRVDRGYTDATDSSITVPFEDFSQPTGTNLYGAANDTMNATVTHVTNGIPNHNSVDAYGRQTGQRSASISWTAAGGFFQTNWTAPGVGNDISSLLTLDFRVSRQCATPGCLAPNLMNPMGPTNFSIRLAMADGTLSGPVQLKTYSDLRGPVGVSFPSLHPILQTVRIPLTAFAGADLTQVHGIRFTFDDTTSGAIHMADIRLSTMSGLVPPPPPSVTSLFELGAPALALNGGDVNVINSVRNIGSSPYLNGAPAIEVAVTSNRIFTVHDEFFVMRIGNQQSAISRYADSGDTHTLIFTFPQSVAATEVNQQVIVQFSASPVPGLDWNFGPLPPAQ